MHTIDYIIFVVYMIAMLGVGLISSTKNKTAEDFYTGGRNMNSWHIGLSVVATDVGGGFQLVLGGLVLPWDLCSWMLFTGLLCLLSAVYLIPKVAILDTNINFSLFHKFRSF
jgi:SSS family solute:Na+ symporter